MIPLDRATFEVRDWARGQRVAVGRIDALGLRRADPLGIIMLAAGLPIDAELTDGTRVVVRPCHLQVAS
jgi:hypothetical protein